MSFVICLQCVKCSKEYSALAVQNTCSCGSPLFVKYDLQKIKQKVSTTILKERTATIWRYREFLPVYDPNNIISLGEGGTPIIHLRSMDKLTESGKIYLKHEGLNPTGTFKDRGASVAVSKALELGIQRAMLNSTGNAGAAWAAYSARAGLDLFLLMPHDVQESCLKQCYLNRAHILLLKTPLHRLSKITHKLSKEYQIFNACSFKEPYRVEGKKTMGLEIAEDLHWKLPDVLVYPTGTGTGIVGIWKAFTELAEINWIAPKFPRIVVAQLEGCSPYVKAFNEDKTECDEWTNVTDVPGGIRSPKPACDVLVLEIIRKSLGKAIAVSLTETLSCQKDIAQTQGLHLSPEGATAVAAFKKLKSEGWITENEKVLILSTGNGLKYLPMIEQPSVPCVENEEDIPSDW